MENKTVIDIVLRYLSLVLLGSYNLFIFYFVFTPLTLRPVVWILSLMYSNATLVDADTIFYGGIYADVIPACIAGAAYYLLLILNLSTPMDWKKRLKSVGLIFGIFLILNILRIAIFAGLALGGFEFFDLAHRLTWYFGSTIFVVVIWFFNVWILNIEGVPIYTDFAKLFKVATGNEEISKNKKSVKSEK